MSAKVKPAWYSSVSRLSSASLIWAQFSRWWIAALPHEFALRRDLDVDARRVTHIGLHHAGNPHQQPIECGRLGKAQHGVDKTLRIRLQVIGEDLGAPLHQHMRIVARGNRRRRVVELHHDRKESYLAISAMISCGSSGGHSPPCTRAINSRKYPSMVAGDVSVRYLTGASRSLVKVCTVPGGM